MKTLCISSAVATLAAAVWIVTSSDKLDPAPTGHRPASASVRPSQTPKAANSIGDLPRATHHNGKAACSHDHAQDVKVDLLIADQNSKSWPEVVVRHLENNHPISQRGLKHLTRSISYTEFEQLDEEQIDRLILYADFAQQAKTRALPNLCWAPDTQPVVQSVFEKVRFLAIAENSESEPQTALRGVDRWSSTATDGNTGSEGTPVTITWSFVPDGTTIPGQSNTTGTSNLIAKLNSTYGTSPTGDYEDAPWFELFETAFNYWADVTGNTYVYEPNDDGAQVRNFNSIVSRGILGVRGDVRIGGMRIDGNSNTLAFNYYPDVGDMVIDTDDSSNFTNSNTTKRRFRNVIAHEHGHGLGMAHVCPINRTKLMEPTVTTSYSGVQFDDILTGHGLYGDAMERGTNSKHNDTTATARQLGTVNESYQADQLSISYTGDVDVYKFNVGSGKRLNLRVTPTAQNEYLEGEQVGSSCSSGTLFDPRIRQNLAVRILASDGTTVLATANTAAIGAGEKIDNLLLSQVGEDYFIEVTGGGENNSANNNAQIYSLSLDMSPATTLTGSNYQLTQEGCAPANQASDPGETVTAQITVTNTGATTISNPMVTISGSSNFTSLDDSTKTLSSLAVGASTTVSFQFKIDGACGSSEMLDFVLDTGAGTSTFSQSVILGSVAAVLDEDFESSASLPSEFTADGGSTSQWTVSSSSPIRGSRSVFSVGSNSNTAFLVTPELFVNGPEPVITFRHLYDFENTYDGGSLQIQIENGAWQEWTAAGGSFNANGYNGTVSGGGAWTNDSGQAVVTSAALPEAAKGKNIRIRWRAFYDSSVLSNGWKIDDINLLSVECCEGNVPILSVITSDAFAQEINVSNQGEFTITASSPPATDLQVAYTLSGSATAGVDYQSLTGTATIAAGQQLTTIPVTAIRDGLAEGDETLTITLTLSGNYAVDTGQASLTIQDLPYDNWRNLFFGDTIANTGETEDFDFDGIDNLIEYALGKDPTVINPQLPTASLQNGGTQLVLSYQEDTTLTDIQYFVEISPTLGDGVSPWTSTGVTLSYGPLVDGKRTVTATANVSGDQQFMRLRVVRN
ncbi:hypothetical protein NT6N_11810 [Oceaniferula spumae]|uniref:Calx-beta domain-containing protein n=1 Tax=Oceaniferula spumae TaxID=2979115 RepID=A0AAT9FJ87_9BACT